MRWAVFIDRDKCIGCYACIVACKLEHDLPPHPACPPVGDLTGPTYIRIDQLGPEIRDNRVHQYFQPVLCRHCADAPCIPACPESAIYQDLETGTTLVNKDQCKGCRACLQACSYGAPQFFDDKLHLCDLCFHRPAESRREGGYTACEAACPARVIHVGMADGLSATDRH